MNQRKDRMVSAIRACGLQLALAAVIGIPAVIFLSIFCFTDSSLSFGQLIPCAASQFPTSLIAFFLRYVPGFPDGLHGGVFVFLQALWIVCLLTVLSHLIWRKMNPTLLRWSIVYVLVLLALLLVLAGYSFTGVANGVFVSKEIPKITSSPVVKEAFDCTVRENESYQNCLIETAVRQSTVQEAVSLCEQLRVRDWSNICFTNVALQFGDPSLCSRLDIPTRQTQCVEAAKDFPGLRNPATDIEMYCTQFRSLTYEVLCYARAAAILENEKICDRNFSRLSLQDMPLWQQRCKEFATAARWMEVHDWVFW